jgi:fatty acid desaturase
MNDTSSPDPDRQNQSDARSRRKRRYLLPVVLILVGVVALLYKADYISRSFLVQWWPAVFVFVGVWLLIARMVGRR